MNLQDLPDGTIPSYIVEAIGQDLAVEFRKEAASRRASMARGAETPELSALLLDKFGRGLCKAAHLTGIGSELQREVDQTVRDIDPDFDAHQRARWAAKPAAITLKA